MTPSFPQTLASWSPEEDGAVTVDWVVLTAAIAGLGMAAAAVIWTEIGTANNKISSFVDTQSIKTTF